MEKRVSDFNDKSYFNFKRPKREEKKEVKHTCKCKRIEKADRLDDVRLVCGMCIMILKFFVLLNLLVITSKML